MSYAARVVADSISSAGVRLVTMEVTYPRFVHSELMTHRMFSRNAASSRAIPVGVMMGKVLRDPVEPVWWGKNQKGMQARERLSFEDTVEARRLWINQSRHVVKTVDKLTTSLGLHKQIANRLLEPWSWITVIISATEWSNFFALRCHEDAQPELRYAAEMMRDAMEKHVAHGVCAEAWHTPYLDIDEQVVLALDFDRSGVDDIYQKVSTARCARVSYLTHDGKVDIDKDLELYDRLSTAQPPHASPLEHVATPLDDPDIWCSNFRGWCSYRHRKLGGKHMKQVA